VEGGPMEGVRMGLGAVGAHDTQGGGLLIPVNQ
jgi:hypothetical protein